MGIADLFRPKYRHSDVRVRTEAVKALTRDDAAILVQIARTDRDASVRRIAIEKIDKADVLAEIAAAESERSLKDFAGERAAELWSQAACSEDPESSAAALSGIIKIGDQRALVEVAVRAPVAGTRKRAFGELRDAKALAELAKRDAPQDLRLAAIGRIDDAEVLRGIAMDTTTKEVGLAAVEKIDDKERLEALAQKAKNKAVRQRARKILTEIEEAEKAKKPGISDEMKRRRAEKAQLIRQVESIEASFDFERTVPIVKSAEEAWAKLGVADEGDERFTKAVERFWKRKEIHDQTARSADELRAIEREARAAAPAAVPAPAVQEPAPAPRPEDPARAAREAEAKARREEKERQRAEEDARRAAQAAEREARKKEDAERGAAIAVSLRAMCDDLEKLAASDSKDLRAIDRALQQASKAFDQLGKVPAEERGALSDRYTAARGKLVVRVNEMREAEDWARFANVPKAEALIQTAKEMAAQEATPDLGNRLRQLQALWKEVGPMPQRRSKELWEQFKTACDAVYDKVKGVRAVETEKFAEVAKVKEALIAEAEAVADSTDWAATAEKLKGLQAKWKESGHLPRKQGDELWKRFRAACDKFFERRKPMLDARRDEEAQNLAKKQALIARAQQVAASAPGEGGWGKAIAQIKDLQREWKEIGFVPRRDADAVFKAFRAACDALFAKRDDARDAEANAARAEIDAVKAEIDAVMAGGEPADVVARAVAVRTKAAELEGVDFTAALDAMVRHVLATAGDAVKGTELDPSALRARREKLIARAEELLPKQQTGVSAASDPADIAAQLKNAMRSNAFGDLRFSGRDPIEVVSELKARWADAGPILEDEDRAQQARFEELCKRVLDAAGASARPQEGGERSDRGERRDRGERGERRERRGRRSAEQPVMSDAPATGSIVPAPASAAAPVSAAAPGSEVAPHAVEAAPAPAAAAAPVSPAAPASAVPVPTVDVATKPAKFEPLPPPPVPAKPSTPPEPARARPPTTPPPMEEVDSGWDLGDADPTATKEEPAPPGSSEMAGDAATGGDGIDEPGWD